MYCPLCKAEYRDGFDRCTDCFVGLVTREQAERSCVVMLWEGVNVHKLNHVVDCLKKAGIPHYSKSGATAETASLLANLLALRIGSFLGSLWKNKAASDTLSWQVFVLQTDYAAAEALIAAD